MAKVFISYARADGEQVLGLARQLRAAGVDLWLDQEDIGSGKRWDREIEAALKACDVLLLFLSPASAASDNVLDEVGYALDHGKPVAPVLIAACEPPLRLRRLQAIDATQGVDVDRVRAEIERHGAAAPRTGLSFEEALKRKAAELDSLLPPELRSSAGGKRDPG